MDQHIVECKLISKSKDGRRAQVCRIMQAANGTRTSLTRHLHHKHGDAYAWEIENEKGVVVLREWYFVEFGAATFAGTGVHPKRDAA
jgi:hypothetical protein